MFVGRGLFPYLYGLTISSRRNMNSTARYHTRMLKAITIATYNAADSNVGPISHILHRYYSLLFLYFFHEKSRLSLSHMFFFFIFETLFRS